MMKKKEDDSCMYVLYTVSKGVGLLCASQIHNIHKIHTSHFVNLRGVIYSYPSIFSACEIREIQPSERTERTNQPRNTYIYINILIFVLDLFILIKTIISIGISSSQLSITFHALLSEHDKKNKEKKTK